MDYRSAPLVTLGNSLQRVRLSVLIAVRVRIRLCRVPLFVRCVKWVNTLLSVRQPVLPVRSVPSLLLAPVFLSVPLVRLGVSRLLPVDRCVATV